MLLFLLFLFTASSPAQDAVPGRGLRLQPFNPLPGLRITAINDHGDIAGNHTLYGAVLIKSTGDIQVLGIDGYVSALNNHGQMAITGDNQVFLRQPDGTMEPRTIPGAKSLIAYGINNLGQIVGSADLQAVAWDASGAGRTISIPPCGRFDNPRNRALSINDNGEMLVETQCPGGSYPLYRRAASGAFQAAGTTKYGARAGLNNNGDLFYSATLFVQGRATQYLDAAGRTIYYAYGDLSIWNEKSENIDRISLLAISPSGTLLAGAGYLAKPCPTLVRSRAMFAPLNVGAISVEVSAADDCHWYAGQTYSGSKSVTVPLYGNIGTEPQVSAAGVNITIPPAGSCQYASPGGQLTAPVEGTQLSVPVETAPGCPWTIGVSPGITAEPMSGTGPAEVTLTIAPSKAFVDEVKRFSIAGILRSVSVEGWRCWYDVDSPLPLAPGSGAALITPSTPSACRWSLYSAAPWIHVTRLSFDPIFRFDPNPSSSPRTAELSVAGKKITVTQAAASPGTPLIVEPNNASGPSANFRFTFARGGPGNFTGTQIRIGEDCRLNYDRAANTFTSSGTACRWSSPEAATIDEWITISAKADFSSRGPLPIIASDHLLGVFTATDSFPEVPLPIQPAENIGWLPPAHFQLNRSAGTGGLFRYVFSAQRQFVKANIGNCYFILDAAQETLRLDPADPPRKIGTSARIENNRCVIDLEKSSLSRGVAKHVLNLALQFRSTSPGDYITGTEFPPPVGPSEGTYLSGEFTVLPTVAPPVSFIMDGLLRIGFPARMPVDRARVLIGDCAVEYAAPGLFQTKGCELSEGISLIIGNDLILHLRLTTPLTGAISAEQTPQGGIASGLFPIGLLAPP